MRSFFIFIGLAGLLLTGCESGPKPNFNYQSPDVPPSAFSYDIDYGALAAPKIHKDVPQIPPPAEANPPVPVRQPSPRMPDEVSPAPRSRAEIKPVVDESPVLSINQSRVLNGRVTVANMDAGVCVVNFPLGQLPPIDKVLSVYRQGILVGEIKITGPVRDDNIAADIVSGRVQTNDEARDR